MQKRISFVVALIGLCVVLAWAFWKKESPSSQPRGNANSENQSPAPAFTSAGNSKPNPPGAAGMPAAEPAPALTAQTAVKAPPLSAGMPPDVENELDAVQMAMRQLRTELGLNPVGTNAEITRAILGDNLKQVKIPVPQGSQLNEKGELCDHWGTAYFFHQLSHDRMEIRSAGPDRVMWTDDDVELK